MTARTIWRLSIILARLGVDCQRFAALMAVRAIERGDGGRVFAVRLKPFVW